jgi:hypothetical protein
VHRRDCAWDSHGAPPTILYSVRKRVRCSISPWAIPFWSSVVRHLTIVRPSGQKEGERASDSEHKRSGSGSGMCHGRMFPSMSRPGGIVAAGSPRTRCTTDRNPHSVLSTCAPTSLPATLAMLLSQLEQDKDRPCARLLSLAACACHRDIDVDPRPSGVKLSLPRWRNKELAPACTHVGLVVSAVDNC